MASIVCSDAFVRRFLIAALCTLATAPPAAAQLRVDGNHGLWVRLRGDSAVVHWLTASETRGMLRVRGGGSTATYRTRLSQVHRAAFPIAARDTVRIDFGTSRGEHTVMLRLQPPRRPASVHAMPDTLYIIGDTHGAYDELIQGLKAARIVDERLRWTAGRSHVVFAGDMTDRGPDVLNLLWFLYQLEPQAEAAGGRLHVVLGNHEVMVMLGDLRYVHEKELVVAAAHGVEYDALFDREHSLLGRWLASRPGVVRIGDVLVTHGGVAPEMARVSIEAFDATLARYLHDARMLNDTTPIAAADSARVAAEDEFLWGARSVFWHREYVRSDTVGTQLDEALRLWNARLMVIGHTAVPTISARYDGRVIAAHTPRYGAELLMLVRGTDGLRRYRITPRAEPERF